MSTQVVMPQLSDTMKEGTIVRWLKQEGEAVEAGEILAEIESDKATIDFEAYSPGVMRKILVGEGEKVPVGQPIALIAEEDEDISEDLAEVGAEAAKGKKSETKEPKPAKAEPAEQKPGEQKPQEQKTAPATQKKAKPAPAEKQPAPKPEAPAEKPQEEKKSEPKVAKPAPAAEDADEQKGDLAKEPAEGGGRAKAKREISEQSEPEDASAAEAVEATESQMEKPGRVAKMQVPEEAEEELAEEAERIVGAGAESERYQDVRVKFGGRGVEMGLSQASADRAIAAARSRRQ